MQKRSLQSDQVILIGHTQTTSTGANPGWLKIYIVVHIIGGSCTKPSLTALFSRVHITQ